MGDATRASEDPEDVIGFDAGDQVRQPGRPPSGVVAPQSTPADLAINSDATTTLPDIGTSGATEVEISGQARTSSADVEQLRRQIEALVREKNEVLERNAALESENQSLSELASSMTTFMTPVASSSSGSPGDSYDRSGEGAPTTTMRAQGRALAFGDDGDDNEWAVGGEAPLGPGDLLVLDSAGASEIGPREERGEAAIGRGPGSTIGPARLPHTGGPGEREAVRRRRTPVGGYAG